MSFPDMALVALSDRALAVPQRMGTNLPTIRGMAEIAVVACDVAAVGCLLAGDALGLLVAFAGFVAVTWDEPTARIGRFSRDARLWSPSRAMTYRTGALRERKDREADRAGALAAATGLTLAAAFGWPDPAMAGLAAAAGMRAVRGYAACAMPREEGALLRSTSIRAA